MFIASADITSTPSETLANLEYLNSNRKKRRRFRPGGREF